MSTIFTHRGYSDADIENTMPAFDAAFQGEADGIAIDVQLTKDSEIVLFGDVSLERLTNHSGTVSDYNLLDLKRMHVMHPENERTYTIPSLGDYFEWVKDKDINTIINVIDYDEDDETIEKKLVRYIEGYVLEDKVILASNQSGSLSKLSNNSSALNLGYMFNHESLIDIGLPLSANNLNVLFDFLNRISVNYILPSFDVIDNRLLNLADAYQFKVISLPNEDLSKMLTLPIDGFITNHFGQVITMI